MVNVSIIIVSWNTKDILYGCLRSIDEHTKNVDYKIIVVDNASTDGSAEMVKKNFPSVILIENSKNHGFAIANNQGITIAKGRYILLLNSDTVILNDAISKIVSFAEDNPDAAVIGCKVINPDGALQPTCFMFPSLLNMFLSSTYLYKLFPKSSFFGRERMTWWDRDDVREVDVVTGCFMLVRQTAVKQIGSMDGQFFMYGEETDWCYRFKQAGWKILFTPDAEIIHLGATSSSQMKPEMTLQLRASMLLFLKKHRGHFVHAIACFLVAIFFLLRVPYWLGLAIASSNDRNVHIRTAYTYIRGTLKAFMGGHKLHLEKDFVKPVKS